MEEEKLLKRKRKAVNEGNKSLLITCCIQLAEHYFRYGQYHQAINEYKLVSDKYKEMDKPLDYARANRMIGEAYTHLQQYSKALKHQQIYLEVAKSQKDKLEEQRALATIGYTYLTSYLDIIDNPDKTSLNLAYKSFMKSLVVCESLTGISKRDHMDMSARLFANLGVVQECLGNYDKGIELVQKSIDICTVHEIYEQLERGHTFLASIYAKKEDYSSAVHQYNLAVEVASRLDDKITLMSAALSSKADILIKLSDFYSAKTVLLKAYKLKTPNITERLNIERTLKIVAAMCYTEDSLLTTSSTDYKARKKLYEKMGDGASGLRNYPKAIEYYQKMLEAAINDGDSGKDLCPCYISLAQSYCDNKQYELAIEYFKKEYGVNNTSAKECVSTLFSIVDAMELAGSSLEDKVEIYKTCLRHCSDDGDTHLEGKTLIRNINLLRKNNRLQQMRALEQQLTELGYESSGSDSEEEPTPDIGVDICADDITDCSETEQDLTKPRAARKRNKILIKRNYKGETQLHTACISGNVSLVRHLLDQGHVVNIRDNCGWLPIHEACICGHIEIVTMLLAKGASINDRGGTLCNGMTPLHDAASNGHLEVMQLLLDNGANPNAKTDAGVTPLQTLKNWHKTVRLDPVRQSFYEITVERMMQALEKTGHENDTVTSNKQNVALVQETDEFKDTGSKKSLRPSASNANIGSLRRSINDTDINRPTSSHIQSDESSSDTPASLTSTGSSDAELNAKHEYKTVMENLRRGFKENSGQKFSKAGIAKRPALLQPDEVGDDWLEDDVGLSASKKRRTVAGSYMNTVGTRHVSGAESAKVTKERATSSLRRNLSRNGSISDVPGNFFDSDFDFEQDEFTNSAYRNRCNNVETVIVDGDSEIDKCEISDESVPIQANKRKKQISLISAGFSRNRSNSANNFSVATTSASHKRKQQTKLTSFNIVEADSTTSSGSTSKNSAVHTGSPVYTSSENAVTASKVLNDPILSVDVRIDGRLYRVPIPLSETQTLTIKWLAEEAAKRYCRKQCMKPTLELETKNGAVLADEDLVNILFPLGGLQAEEVNAKILKWNLPPLTERYKEACANMNMDRNEAVLKLLQGTSTTLDLSDLYLRSKALSPICKAINRQSSLYHLNLSGNFMLTENVQLLCSSLPSLENLSILNLSLNHLDAESLNCMAQMFTEAERSILENLVSLDLSYNPLKDDGLKYLAMITRFLKLRTLNLKAVDFTANIFNHLTNRSVELYLEYLENFDISLNQLDKAQILKFLYWIKPQNIQRLDVSRNNVTEDGLVMDLVRLLVPDADARSNLRHLDLSSCRVTDTEVYELLRLLGNIPHVDTLNLSYNVNISAITLRRLVQHGTTLKHLDLSGCENILRYFETCSDKTWTLPESTSLRTLSLSIDNQTHNNECETLTNMWRSRYKQHGYVMADLRDFLKLTVKD